MSTPTSNAKTNNTAKSSITTREQHRRNTEATAEQDDTPSDNRKKEKDQDKTAFKGKIDAMNGHVFQLAEEGRKANQFLQTMDALQDYTIIELDYPQDLQPFFLEQCQDARVLEPSNEPPMSSDGKTRVSVHSRQYLEWKAECENYVDRIKALDLNKRKLFTVVTSQCSISVKHKLESTPGFREAKASYNCKWLLTSLRNICHKFEHTESRFAAMVQAKVALLNLRQGGNQTTTDYYNAFKESLAVLESYGGQVHDTERAAPDPTAIKGLTQEAKNDYMHNHFLAHLFIHNADPARFGSLRTKLSNAFGKGHDDYPSDLVSAQQMLLRYKGPHQTTNTGSGRNSRSNRNRGGRGGGRGDGGSTDRDRSPNSS